MKVDACDTQAQALPTLDIPLITVRSVDGGAQALQERVICDNPVLHRAGKLHYGQIPSGAISFTIERRVPPRGLNDVNLMKRKAS
jgi:hypothetical protein